MRKQLFSTLMVLLALLLVTPAQAQIKTPSASPTAKLETTVGLTDVHVLYSRPSMKGRTIFGDGGLVPFGEIWRTGANQATKVTFGDDVMVAGNKVTAGDYAVLTMPAKGEWTVMFFPYESGSWNSYKEKEPAVKVMAKSMNLGSAVETFTIDVNNMTMDGAHLVMSWAKTAVHVPVKAMVKEQVMANIDRVMAGPGAGDYYSAATFIHDAGDDNKRALEYVQKANKMNDTPRYWMVRREAMILGDLGMKKEAIAKAKESLELAKTAGNMDYVRMNEKSIKEWSRK